MPRGLLAIALLLALPAAAPAQSAAPAVRWSGYIQARETYRDDVGLTASINRARLTAAGGGAKDVTWRVQGEFRSGSVGTGRASVALQDAYVRYKPGALGVQAGQFKTPFTREFITSLADLETADRAAAVDSLAPKRDIGLMADYAFGAVATAMLGVFTVKGRISRRTPIQACWWWRG
jgi:phosphate-selective porin